MKLILASATIGEISDALRRLFGEYRNLLSSDCAAEGNL
jgi:hypothetical protein